MFNRQIRANIKDLDLRINALIVLASETTEPSKLERVLKEIEGLTKVRCDLADSKVKESNAPAVISGLFGISTVLLVLYYEKTDVVTSKAFSMATGLFKGSR